MNSAPDASRPVAPFTRRQFLTAAGAAAIVLPRSTWAIGGRVPASERITIGVIGWGMMGPINTEAFLEQSDCQVVAACDLDPKHLQAAVDTINQKYGNTDCKAYHDYRELLARDDIDAVMIAIPDQWHAIVATEAANRKKDIYGEKPLARTVAEQQAIVKAVQKNNVIWQTGSWQRSVPQFHKAAEIVRSGLIGTVTNVEVGLPGGHHDFASTVPALMTKLASLPDKIMSPAQIVAGTPAWDLAVTEPHEGFDYGLWLGPSKMEPYIEQRVDRNWRWNYNTGGGQLLDWIGHHGDIAHWGLGFDTCGPSEVEGTGEFPAAERRLEHLHQVQHRLHLSQGSDAASDRRDMTIAGGQPRFRWAPSGSAPTAGCGSIGAASTRPTPNGQTGVASRELRKVPLYESKEHRRNFLDCVRRASRPSRRSR